METRCHLYIIAFFMTTYAKYVQPSAVMAASGVTLKAVRGSAPTSLRCAPQRPRPLSSDGTRLSLSCWGGTRPLVSGFQV